MKRLLPLVILISVIFTLASPPVFALGAEGRAQPEINAPAAILMEKETGTVLYEKNAHEPGFPASITKIMTMLLIVEDIEAGRLRLDDTVIASERAASFGGSCVYLEAGEQMSVSDMLKCIAVVSANDCAVAMAEHISGSEEKFVERMNKRAKELGLENTHFSNCSGLFDDGAHFTTAYDVALMSRELIKHDIIKDYTTIWMDSIRGGEFELSNTNKLAYWYPGCTGLKTGYTSTSRYCLSATAERNGVEYIAVVMHCETSDSRNKDAETLLDYAFSSFRLCPLNDGSPLPDVHVELGREESVKAEYTGDSVAVIPKGGEPEYKLELRRSVPAPVRKGGRLGTLTVSADGRTVAEVPVCAAEDVPRLGFFGFFARLAAGMFAI